MRSALVILLASAALACGGDDGDSGGDSSGESGGDSPGERQVRPSEPEATCVSFEVDNAYAAEKVNAAICVGGPGTRCKYLDDIDITHCENDEYWYEVDWYETRNGTNGDVYGNDHSEASGPVIGILSQASDGSFRFEDAETGREIGYCTVVGDVGNVCTWQ